MDIIAILTAALFGLLIGSFLNVVIYRFPIMLDTMWQAQAKEILHLPTEKANTTFNLFIPPSRCGHCGARVKPWQNIPIISWLLLRGQCQNCKGKISIRYPLVELLTGTLFALIAWRYGWSYITIGGCLLTSFIIALTFIDADTQFLPDDLTLPLIWLGLLFNLYTGFISIQQSIIGAVMGYLSLWLLFNLYKLLTGKEGMGYGDFKMLSAVGAWVGVQSLPIIVLIASFIGIISALIQRVKKDQRIPFGPYLAIAGWLVFLLHTQTNAAIQWWLHKSGF